MDKIIRDGLIEKLVRYDTVAVLVSPGYGAGWSTWHEADPCAESMLFDPQVVYWVLEGKIQDQLDMVKQGIRLRYPDAYMGGVQDLTVVWVPIGKKFRITEYDGSESIVFPEDYTWKVA